LKATKRRTVGSRILKYVLLGAGSILLLALALFAWIYLTLSSGPGPMEMSDFHPFKSPKAKAEYLAFEDTLAAKWPVVSEQRLVKTSFGTTFMRISGPVDAPPLVLLPGGGTCSLIWNANIEALSQQYRTYALDNIYDYGRSVYTRKMESGGDMAAWLDELFDVLHPGNDIRIMGYSFGGWVTSQYALHHPQRLHRVVLIAPANTVLPIPGPYIRRMITTLIPVRYFVGKIMYWVWQDLARMGESGRQIVEDRISYFRLAMKSFKFKQPVNPTLLTDEEIHQMAMPVLFLVGGNETAFNAADAVGRLHRLNPKIRTETIPGTGHDVMFTHTEMVNQLVLDFLRD